MKLTNIAAILSGPIWLAVMTLAYGSPHPGKMPIALAAAGAISAAAVFLLYLFQRLFGSDTAWLKEKLSGFSPQEKRFASIGLLIGPFFGFAKVLYQGHLPYTSQYGSDWPEFLIAVAGLSVISAVIGLLVGRTR